MAPEKLQNTEFAVIVDKLNKHFEPKDSIIVKRFIFRKRMQLPGETLTSYIAQLRKLADGCNFQVLEEELRDQLVVGILDSNLQKKLLSDSNLTFKSATDMAIASEAANLQVDELKNTATVNKAEVYKPRGQEKNTSKPCWRCTGNHQPETCWAVNQECHYCTKIGHIEKACLAKKKNLPRVTKEKTGKKPEVQKQKNNNMVEEVTEDRLYDINWVNNNSDPIVVKVCINGVSETMQVDTGCSNTIVGETVFEKIKNKSNIGLKPSTLHLKTWTNQKVGVLGETIVTVKYKGQIHELPMLVGTGNGVSLLGRNWLNVLGIQINGINVVSAMTEESVQQIINKFPEVFDGNLTGHKGTPVKIELKEGHVPKFLKYRNLPFAIKPKVEAALEKLVQQGILTPVQHSKWATPIVPVVKPNKEVRICGDYRSTVIRQY